MKKIIFSVFAINNIAFASSDLFSNSEAIKDVLSKNVYEPNYFTMILGLFVVILMIYITGFIYQKLTKVKLAKVNANNKAQVISTTTLGQGRNLHVVKIGKEYCLLGSTQNNITFLKDVKMPDEIDEQYEKMIKEKQSSKQNKA